MRALLAVITAFTLSACSEYVEEPVEGTVVAVSFVPAEASVVPVIGLNGDFAVGFSSAPSRTTVLVDTGSGDILECRIAVKDIVRYTAGSPFTAVRRVYEGGRWGAPRCP